MAVDAPAAWGPAADSEQQAGPAYPLEVTYGPAEAYQRFWAVPVLGGLAKIIILVPHLVILALLGLLFSPELSVSSTSSSNVEITVAGLAFYVLWIPVLLSGHMPLWAHAMVGGFLRWMTRTAAFFLGLTDAYPPFSMRSSDHPVAVSFHIPERNSRWWAIPIVGFYVKQLILIPHYICLLGAGVVVGFLWLFMWIPVLMTGRFPAGPRDFVGGWLRWGVRVLTFQAGLTDRYPPFSMR